MKTAFLFITMLLLGGCSSIWQSKEPITPISYVFPKDRNIQSVGALRKLALMPVLVDVHTGMSITKEEKNRATRMLENNLKEYLTVEKGYETLILSGPNGEWRSDLFEDNTSNMEQWNRLWQETNPAKLTPGLIQKVGRSLNVDGILVVKMPIGDDESLVYPVLMVGLMFVPMFYDLATDKAEGWIYETSSGRLVWYSEDKGAPTITRLFKDMDNAIPKQLIK